MEESSFISTQCKTPSISIRTVSQDIKENNKNLSPNIKLFNEFSSYKPPKHRFTNSFVAQFQDEKLKKAIKFADNDKKAKIQN